MEVTTGARSSLIHIAGIDASSSQCPSCNSSWRVKHLNVLANPPIHSTPNRLDARLFQPIIYLQRIAPERSSISPNRNGNLRPPYTIALVRFSIRYSFLPNTLPFRLLEGHDPFHVSPFAQSPANNIPIPPQDDAIYRNAVSLKRLDRFKTETPPHWKCQNIAQLSSPSAPLRSSS